MSIFTAQGRFCMARSFWRWASNKPDGVNPGPEHNGLSPLWMGFGRGVGASIGTERNIPWTELQVIPGNSQPPIANDPSTGKERPPNPLLYPGPQTKTLSQTDPAAALPVGYYTSTNIGPEFYKRCNSIQYVYPDLNGQYNYLNNTYSVYATEEQAQANNCCFVYVSCTVSYADLAASGITPSSFMPRQQGLYAAIPEPGAPSISIQKASSIDPDGSLEQTFGLMLVNNVVPLEYVEYQARVSSFIVRF